MNATESKHLDVSIPESIYSSPESLETYLSHIQKRLERRRIEVEQKAYWKFAVAQLTDHCNQARELEAPELVNELESLIQEFEHRLKGCRDEKNPGMGIYSPAETSSSYYAAVAVAPFAPSPWKEGPRPLTEAEKESVLEALHSKLESFKSWWKELESTGLHRENGNWDYPQCFRLRALSCALARLQIEARANGLENEMRIEVQRLRDSIDMEREIRGERALCPPFQDQYWAVPRTSLSTDLWEEMEQQYIQTAEAHEVWEWYCQRWEGLPPDTRITLLNSVAAVQQLLYRILDSIGGRDKLQTDFFIDLREEARAIGYLNALNQITSDIELRHLSDELDERFQEAQQAWETHLELEEQQERKAQREAAIQAVVALFARCPELGKAPSQLPTDRATLFPLLEECLATNVPSTNVKIRNCLLEAGPRLLQNEPRFIGILEAVLTHRKRQGLDISPAEESESIHEEEEPTEDILAETLHTVLPFTTDKRIVILGGTPRQHTCEKLKELVQCAEVKWPPSKESDKTAKFETDVRKADIVLLLLKFASHDMCDRSREWIRESGGDLINVRMGYGVNQLVHNLYDYIRSGEARRETA